MLKKRVSFVAMMLVVLVGGALTASVRAENNPPMRSKRIKVILSHRGYNAT